MKNELSNLENWDIIIVVIKTIHLGDELFFPTKGKEQSRILGRNSGPGSCFSMVSL